jgi:hypothetical protein
MGRSGSPLAAFRSTSVLKSSARGCGLRRNPYMVMPREHRHAWLARRLQSGERGRSTNKRRRTGKTHHRANAARRANVQTPC